MMDGATQTPTGKPPVFAVFLSADKLRQLLLKKPQKVKKQNAKKNSHNARQSRVSAKFHPVPVKQFLKTSKFGKHDMIQYPSRRKPDTVFEYIHTTNPRDRETTYYKCKACNAMKNAEKNLGPSPMIAVRYGYIITDPENPKRGHYCQPIPKWIVSEQNKKREARKNCLSQTIKQKPDIFEQMKLSAKTDDKAENL